MCWQSESYTLLYTGDPSVWGREWAGKQAHRKSPRNEVHRFLVNRNIKEFTLNGAVAASPEELPCRSDDSNLWDVKRRKITFGLGQGNTKLSASITKKQLLWLPDWWLLCWKRKTLFGINVTVRYLHPQKFLYSTDAIAPLSFLRNSHGRGLLTRRLCELVRSVVSWVAILTDLTQALTASHVGRPFTF